MNLKTTIKSLLPGSILSETVQCPGCDAKYKLQPGPETEIINCHKCHIGITYPPPKNTESTDLIWEHAYSNTRQETRPTWTFEAQKRLDWIHLWKPDGEILELGSGFGEFLEIATKNGHECYGIEPSPKGREATFVHCSSPVFESIETWLNSNSSLQVDVIAAWHVVEHLRDPSEALKKLSASLKKDGLVFGEVPNFGSTNAQLFGTKWESSYPEFHYHHFSKRGITKLLKKSGLEIINAQEITSRIYESADLWGRRKNNSLIDGTFFPDKALLRFIARKN